MKKYLLCSLISLPLWADPFYAEEISQGQTQQADQNSPESAKIACQPLGKINALDIQTAFSELRLIGILKREDNFKAIFMDKQENLLGFQANDYLREQGIQFSQIDFGGLKYIDWHKTQACDQPHQVNLKL
ncbi:hypothetical protein A4G20_10235 [Pasteurellaceae bacterium RH1A]|nr:hypothetical protein A4G20_10235 [Pasteurellaceae bacterium RH1A]